MPRWARRTRRCSYLIAGSLALFDGRRAPGRIEYAPYPICAGSVDRPGRTVSCDAFRGAATNTATNRTTDTGATTATATRTARTRTRRRARRATGPGGPE